VKQLQALLYKEWRDQRALLAGSYVLCVLLVVVARIVAGKRFGPQLREEALLQACLATIVVVLAVESVVRDRQRGVDDALARLPIRTAPGWASKIVFVVLAASATLVGLVVLEAAILLFEGHPLLGGLLSMIQPVWWLAIAALAAACHACARVLGRSLPAALLGIALVVGVPLAANEAPVGRTREIVDIVLASWTPGVLALLVCAAFLLGSLLAYRVRRLDPIGWRRAGGALLGVVLVLGPVFANSVRLGEWAFDIVPFSRPVEVEFAFPSPDGRHVALQVRQVWYPKRDWLPLTGSRTGTNCRARSEIWILDPHSGEVREIDERFRRVPCDQPWDAEGKLATVSTPGAFGDGDYTAERIDPTSAKVVEAHLESEIDHQDYRYGLDRWLERRSDGEQGVYTWRGTKLELRLPRDIRPIVSPEPGVLFYESGNAWVRYEFASDTTRALVAPLDCKDPLFRISPDGRFLRQLTAGALRIIDARDGHLVWELQRETAYFTWSKIPGRIGFVQSPRWSECLKVLLDDGSLKTMPRVSGWRMSEMGPDWVLEARQGSIECVRVDGAERRVLYEAKR